MSPEKTLPVITIDGPAGSGKSTVAKLVANVLQLTYLDTGAMYRALTLAAFNEGIYLTDNNNNIESQLSSLAEKTKIDLVESQVFLNNQDVSQAIREPKISDHVSIVARQPLVRKVMTKWQREKARLGGFVLDGRDTGSVVFPDADFKFFLTASIEERARRRYLELQEKGIEVDYAEIKQKIASRDKIDSEREVAPLIIPEGAYVLDTTNLSIDEAVQEIVKRCRIR